VNTSLTFVYTCNSNINQNVCADITYFCFQGMYMRNLQQFYIGACITWWMPFFPEKFFQTPNPDDFWDWFNLVEDEQDRISLLMEIDWWTGIYCFKWRQSFILCIQVQLVHARLCHSKHLHAKTTLQSTWLCRERVGLSKILSLTRGSTNLDECVENKNGRKKNRKVFMLYKCNIIACVSPVGFSPSLNFWSVDLPFLLLPVSREYPDRILSSDFHQLVWR